ncbi:MAG: thioredoxin domain-containing protein, partial [Candidatus Lindowbacteria bacterium]|nr:thioredoxin domain-containing protein [Candidatus Lindowbacteria bacterium]
QLESKFDSRFGGLGSSPKFPPHASLRLLLAESAANNPSAEKMLHSTLSAMAQGGIHDHVGGGFARYSTDTQWLLPHFEKMLYDNAQLIRIYAEGYAATGCAEYKRTAEGIFDWLTREMTAESGGFYSALDADSEGEEGKYYFWSANDVATVLGDDADLISRVFNLKEEGNFVDPMIGHEDGNNILHLTKSLEELAESTDEDTTGFVGTIVGALERLRVARELRVPPGRDDKIQTNWNGLMIAGLATAGRHLENDAMIDAAERCATFLLEQHVQDEVLYHSSRGNSGLRFRGYLDDYVFLSYGLLELHCATGKSEWLKKAEELVDQYVALFWDEAQGGFYFTSKYHEQLLIRNKDPIDKAEPSGNGIASEVLLRVGRLTERDDLVERSRKTIEAFRSILGRAPSAMMTYLLTINLSNNGAVDDVGSNSSPSEDSDQASSSAGIKGGRFPIGITLLPETLIMKPGSSASFEVEIQVSDSWHINSNRPNQEYLRPTLVGLEDEDWRGRETDFTITNLEYPEAQFEETEYGTKPLSIFKGSIKITGTLEASNKLRPSMKDVVFSIRYQPCDASKCLSPDETLLTLPVVIE